MTTFQDRDFDTEVTPPSIPDQLRAIAAQLEAQDLTDEDYDEPEPAPSPLADWERELLGQPYVPQAGDRVRITGDTWGTYGEYDPYHHWNIGQVVTITDSERSDFYNGSYATKSDDGLDQWVRPSDFELVATAAVAAEQARIDSLVLVHGPWEAADLAKNYPGIRLSHDILNVFGDYASNDLEDLFQSPYSSAAGDLTSGTNYALGRAVINPERLGEFRPVEDEEEEEPAPAFEVGDRVRNISDRWESLVGVTGVITRLRGNGYAYHEVKLDERRDWASSTFPFLADEIELITEPKPFEIGDKVKVIAEPVYRLSNGGPTYSTPDVQLGDEGVIVTLPDEDGDHEVRIPRLAARVDTAIRDLSPEVLAHA